MDTVRHTHSGAIRVHRDDAGTTILLVGEVDAALRAEASASMAAALVSDGPLVVDSSEATFVDSSGLAFVLQLHRAATEAGIRVTLRDPGRVLREVLELAGLAGLIAEEPSAT